MMAHARRKTGMPTARPMVRPICVEDDEGDRPFEGCPDDTGTAETVE